MFSIRDKLFQWWLDENFFWFYLKISGKILKTGTATIVKNCWCARRSCKSLISSLICHPSGIFFLNFDFRLPKFFKNLYTTFSSQQEYDERWKQWSRRNKIWKWIKIHSKLFVFFYAFAFRRKMKNPFFFAFGWYTCMINSEAFGFIELRATCDAVKTIGINNIFVDFTPKQRAIASM